MCEIAARIAELEREIVEWEKEALAANKDGDAYIAEENLTHLRAELTRLRNESPALTQGEGSEPHRPLDVDFRGLAYAMVQSQNASPPPLPAGNADPFWVVEQEGRYFVNSNGEQTDDIRKARQFNTKNQADSFRRTLPHPHWTAEVIEHLWICAPKSAGNADPRVREALEGAAKVCDDYGREGDRLSKAFECETADELAARIRALTLPSPQSQGPVDAAEWQNKAIIALEAIAKLHGPAIEMGPAIASGFFEASSRASDRSAT